MNKKNTKRRKLFLLSTRYIFDIIYYYTYMRQRNYIYLISSLFNLKKDGERKHLNKHSNN